MGHWQPGSSHQDVLYLYGILHEHGSEGAGGAEACPVVVVRRKVKPGPARHPVGADANAAAVPPDSCRLSTATMVKRVVEAPMVSPTAAFVGEPYR